MRYASRSRLQPPPCRQPDTPPNRNPTCVLISCLFILSSGKRGIRAGTISAGVAAVLAALRLKLPEAHPALNRSEQSSGTATDGGTARGGGGSTDRVSRGVRGLADDASALSAGHLSLGEGHGGGDSNINRSHSATPNAKSPFYDELCRDGHGGAGHYGAFGGHRSEWAGDCSGDGGARAGGGGGGVGGGSSRTRGAPWVVPPLPPHAAAWLPQAAHSSASRNQPPQQGDWPSDRDQRPHVPPPSQLPPTHYQQHEYQHQQHQHLRSELQDPYRRDNSGSDGGGLAKATAAPLQHAPGPLFAASLATAGRRCGTCGGAERLEADADNPGDVYCGPCWEAYEM